MIKREQPALPSPSLPSHPICVHSSPHPVPGSQEQLEPTVCTEQGLSSAWNTIHCFLRLFLMCYKDCHPITSPPIERMIRKINNNNLCVLSNFLVPGTVLAKHYLWTSQQPFLNSPSHTQRNQPSLGIPAVSSWWHPSLHSSPSWSASTWHLLPSMLGCPWSSNSSGHLLSANCEPDAVFFSNTTKRRSQH